MTRIQRLLVIVAGVALGVVAVVVAGVITLRADDEAAPRAERPPETDYSPPVTDYSARFARFTAAEEPNVDSSTVKKWPAFVTEAGREVKRLYEFQLENGDLMRYMPCFCGCGRSGHRNNRDCFVRRVNADGSVVFDGSHLRHLPGGHA